VLLRPGPEPTIPEEKKLRQDLQTLLNVAAEQQAESSASRPRTRNARFIMGPHAHHGSRAMRRSYTHTPPARSTPTMDPEAHPRRVEG
jgi:hypothetical protein